MEQNENPISKAIKTKLRLVDDEVEEAWRWDRGAIYGQLNGYLASTGGPTDRDYRDQIESFAAITATLVKRKAKSMIATALEALSNVGADENLQVDVKNFILTFFDYSDYTQCLPVFVDEVERKFSSWRKDYNPEELGLTKIEDLFQSYVKDALRTAREEINADFTLLHAQTTAKHLEVREEADRPISNDLSEQYVLKKTGPGWMMVFDGKEIAPLKQIGYAYFHYCIQNYPKEFTNIELEKAVTGKTHIPLDHEPFDADYDEESDEKPYGFQIGGLKSVTSRQELSDPNTIKKIKNRYKEVEIEIAEADRDHDQARLERLQKEKTSIEQYILGCERKGRLKPFKDEVSKISERVSRAMDRALDDLRPHSEEAYLHLHEAFKPIHSSTKRYKPAEQISWILE